CVSPSGPALLSSVFLFLMVFFSCSFAIFFFSDTATAEIYTLSLHDALPIFVDRAVLTALSSSSRGSAWVRLAPPVLVKNLAPDEDRKSTRLNSSHVKISYAVFCLKKKTTPSLSQSLQASRVVMPPAIDLRIQ